MAEPLWWCFLFPLFCYFFSLPFLFSSFPSFCLFLWTRECGFFFWLKWRKSYHGHFPVLWLYGQDLFGQCWKGQGLCMWFYRLLTAQLTQLHGLNFSTHPAGQAVCLPRERLRLSNLRKDIISSPNQGRQFSNPLESVCSDPIWRCWSRYISVLLHQEWQ